MKGNERTHGPDEVGSGEVPPEGRLRHIEHPVALYTIMELVPNTLTVPADADGWIRPFASASTLAFDGRRSATEGDVGRGAVPRAAGTPLTGSPARPAKRQGQRA